MDKEGTEERGAWLSLMQDLRATETSLVCYMVESIEADFCKQEVELLPTLGAVGPKNFPGMIDAAYIVNAGWTQRSLWKVTQKLVPKSAMEKIRFLDSSNEVEEFFDLDRLPKGVFRCC